MLTMVVIIGIVFERERIKDEMDCMRWYVPDDAIGRSSADEVLYEEMFHCTDLGMYTYICIYIYIYIYTYSYKCISK
jgi:hypothetical protein